MSFDMTGISPVFWDLRHGEPIPMQAPPPPLTVCLGNFDGVHKGHASLLHLTKELRDQQLPNALCGVFTFYCPSTDYLRGVNCEAPSDKTFIGNGQFHLTTLEEKLSIFHQLGMDFVCLCEFESICSLSPEGFLSFLSHALGVRGAVCGFNYHFGAQGRGTAAQLKAYFDRPEDGYYAKIADPVIVDGEAVSATYIRRLLQEGHADTAIRHLGRPYALESVVVKGKRLGRKLGFPTANQYFYPESLLPALGVYAVLCHTPLGVFPGVANIGSHPTVDEHAEVNCETHIFGPAQDLYGYRMRVEFLCRLRPEKQFSSLEALTAAISADAIAAEAYVKQYLTSHK